MNDDLTYPFEEPDAQEEDDFDSDVTRSFTEDWQQSRQFTEDITNTLDADDFDNVGFESELSSETRHQPGRMTGEAWLIRLKSYNEEAWNQLFNDYATELNIGIARSLSKVDLPGDRVDDIAQETWHTAIEQIHDFKWQGEDKLYHWLRSISFNHVRTLRRKISSREISIEDTLQSEGDIDIDIFPDLYNQSEETPETILLRTQQMELFNSALLQLKPRDQEILTRHLYGETPAQIALLYGIKPASVSMVLFRAKTIIRTLLHGEN